MLRLFGCVIAMGGYLLACDIAAQAKVVAASRKPTVTPVEPAPAEPTE